jgi:hypothetical protein
LEQPQLRRQATAELNKGESRNALARAGRFHRLGQLRDRTVEAQQHRAGGLTLVTAAIALWKTVYIGRALDALRTDGELVPDALLAHLAPLGWQHINLTGDYLWDADAMPAMLHAMLTRHKLRSIATRPRLKPKSTEKWSPYRINRSAAGAHQNGRQSRTSSDKRRRWCCSPAGVDAPKLGFAVQLRFGNTVAKVPRLPSRRCHAAGAFRRQVSMILQDQDPIIRPTLIGSRRQERLDVVVQIASNRDEVGGGGVPPSGA